MGLEIGTGVRYRLAIAHLQKTDELRLGKIYKHNFAKPETAAVNKLLDTHAGGDIYRCKHPLRTSVAIYKWRKKSSNAKRRQLKFGTYLAKLTSSQYLGPHKVSV